MEFETIYDLEGLKIEVSFDRKVVRFNGVMFSVDLLLALAEPNTEDFYKISIEGETRIVETFKKISESEGEILIADFAVWLKRQNER